MTIRSSSSAAPSASSERSIALAIGLLALAVYLLVAALHFQSIDELATEVLARNLAWRGAIDVDWLAWSYPVMGKNPVVAPGIDGHVYGLKDIGPSLLLVPLIRLAFVMGVSPIRASMLLSPLITAGVAGLLYLCVRSIGYRRRTAVAAALIYGLATMALPYTRTLFTQVLGELGMLMALWGAIDAVAHRRWRSALLGGIGMGIAGLSVTVLWVTLPLYVLYLLPWGGWRDGRWRGEIEGTLRLVAIFAAGALPFLLALAAYNAVRFGSPFLNGFQQAGTSDLRLSYLGVGSFGQLVSLPRGIIWYVPVSLLVPFGVWLARKSPFARPAWLALTQLLLVFGVYSSYWIWWGGGSFGPRFLVVLMPALALLIAPVLDRAWQARSWVRVVVGGLIGLSAITQIVNSLFDFYPADELMYEGLWKITPPPALWVYPSVLTDLSQNIYQRMWTTITGQYWDVLWLARGSVDWLLLLSQIGLMALAFVFLAMILRRPAERKQRWGLAVQALLTLLVVLLMLYRYPYTDDSEPQPTPVLDQAIDIIEQNAGPSDTVITLLPTRGTEWLNRYPARVADAGLTFESPLRPESIQLLEVIEAHAPQIWLVTEATTSGDPNNGVEHWLSERSFGGSAEWLDPFRVMTYSLYPPVEALEEASAVFGDGQIGLTGHGVAAAQTPNGWSVNVWLRWEALREGDIPYTVFVHVRDAGGGVLGQHDGPPQTGFAPTPGWQAGQVVDDRHHIRLPLDVPPGQYTIVVGLYDSNTGARLPLSATGQDTLDIGTVTVGPGE